MSRSFCVESRRGGDAQQGFRIGLGLGGSLLVLLLPALAGAAADAARPARSESSSIGSSGSVFPRAFLRGMNYPVSSKVLRYAERIVKQYDTNGDGQLQADEWKAMKGDPVQIDLDRDTQISVDEYARYIAKYGRSHQIHLVAPPTPAYIETLPALFQPAAEAQASSDAEPTSESEEEDMDTEEDELELMLRPPSERSVRRKSRYQQKFYIPRSKLPTGLPEWFVQRDTDGDGQVSLAEFAPGGGRLEAAEFARYDTDRDGMITAKECLEAGKAAKSVKKQ